MKIVKVMNNSLVLAKDESGKEIVYMGKGIGFKAKADDELDESKIEKTFVLKDDTSTKEYVRLIEKTPNEYIDIVNNIIDYAKEKYNFKLNDQVFITLIDHICFAIERYRSNIKIQNRLVWEVKKFYPKEFQTGVYAVDYINNKLSIDLPEEEAANIAFHIVNAQIENGEMEDTMLTVKMLKDIFNIVQYNTGVKVNKDSISYSRFVTHLQFFIQRLLEDKTINSKDSFILNQIKKEYPLQYKCATLIREYVNNLLDKSIGDEELLYLTIHIIRVIER